MFCQVTKPHFNMFFFGTTDLVSDRFYSACGSSAVVLPTSHQNTDIGEGSKCLFGFGCWKAHHTLASMFCFGI